MSTNAVKKQSEFLHRLDASKYLLLLLLPALIYFFIFAYVPMYGVIAAFKNYKLFLGLNASEWVGFKYFELFFSSSDMLVILKNTILLGVYTLLWSFPFSLIFALVLNEVKHLRYKKLVQTVSYMPYFISTVVIVGLVQLFLSPTYGIVNHIIESFGYEKVVFLQNASYFRTIFIASDIWQKMGWDAIIYIAALANIDPNLYEAAMIDGANRFERLIHITLPCISATIITLLLLKMGSVVNVSFEKVFLLQNEAIYSTSDVIQTYVWRQGLQAGNFSYGTAVGLFNSVVNTIFLIGSNFLARRYSETSLW